MARHFTRFGLAPAVVVGALVLSSCGSPADTEPDAAEDSVTTVVASTSVYGDVAARIGGDEVEVESIISTTAQDPHSYEATAQDKLSVSKADLVVGNGGGYDFFLEQLVGDLDLDDDFVIYAVDSFEESHEDHEDHADDADDHDHADDHDDHADEHEGHEHGDFNEHVWYDLHTVSELAHEIAESLEELDPENGALYLERYEEFAAELDDLAQRQAGLADGETYAMTEPVPYYLLQEAGLENVTPSGYSEAIEHGDDVAPLIQKELVDLLEAGDVVVLAYNPQTESPQTEAARRAAENAGVAVVEFTETLPEGEDYAGWMSANISALEEALDR
ncbi:metal ABC transporter solute-binding protein, Zn/Mn family [Zhihengliuella halotolerans]|uniref:Zinc/manganese transport system substrate-binding protein n=1 Tax=Zhihengliuella halotolerans TaxID=370736 RepID=A0A4Q8ADI4_9MICC|nr:zinc ABC transporter substrate-binding protein [Zhihengliuella halotolerans]RZU61693.1 zinc/manganese transport system substrate-binding protein [Zhihengliuella halotolerans]